MLLRYPVEDGRKAREKADPKGRLVRRQGQERLFQEPDLPFFRQADRQAEHHDDRPRTEGRPGQSLRVARFSRQLGRAGEGPLR